MKWISRDSSRNAGLISVQSNPAITYGKEITMKNSRLPPIKNKPHNEVLKTPYQRFNEITGYKGKSKGYTLHYSPRSAAVDLALTNDNKTVTAPLLVNTRGELNKTSYITKEDWRVKNETQAPIFTPPEGFPIRNHVNFLLHRAKEAEYSKRSKSPVERPCKHRTEEEEELERKRKAMAFAKLQKILAKRTVQTRTQEKEKANTEDIEVIPKTCVKKIIKPVLKTVLKQKEYKPYIFTNELMHSREIIADFPKEKTPVRRPVFLHFGPIDTGLVSMNRFINDLSEKFTGPVQHYSPQKVRAERPQELIIVLSKAYKFGDKTPRSVAPSEYTQNFSYYKLDPTAVIEFLTDNLKDKEITLNELKELLKIVGIPLDKGNEIKELKPFLRKHNRHDERLLQVKSSLDGEKFQEEIERRMMEDHQAIESERIMQMPNKPETATKQTETMPEEKEMPEENEAVKETASDNQKFTTVKDEPLYKEKQQPEVKKMVQKHDSQSLGQSEENIRSKVAYYKSTPINQSPAIPKKEKVKSDKQLANESLNVADKKGTTNISIDKRKVEDFTQEKVQEIKPYENSQVEEVVLHKPAVPKEKYVKYFTPNPNKEKVIDLATNSEELEKLDLSEKDETVEPVPSIPKKRKVAKVKKVNRDEKNEKVEAIASPSEIKEIRKNEQVKELDRDNDGQEIEFVADPSETKVEQNEGDERAEEVYSSSISERSKIDRVEELDQNQDDEEIQPVPNEDKPIMNYITEENNKDEINDNSQSEKTKVPIQKRTSTKVKKQQGKPKQQRTNIKKKPPAPQPKQNIPNKPLNKYMESPPAKPYNNQVKAQTHIKAETANITPPQKPQVKPVKSKSRNKGESMNASATVTTNISTKRGLEHSLVFPEDKSSPRVPKEMVQPEPNHPPVVEKAAGKLKQIFKSTISMHLPKVSQLSNAPLKVEERLENHDRLELPAKSPSRISPMRKKSYLSAANSAREQEGAAKENETDQAEEKIVFKAVYDDEEIIKLQEEIAEAEKRKKEPQKAEVKEVQQPKIPKSKMTLDDLKRKLVTLQQATTVLKSSTSSLQAGHKKVPSRTTPKPQPKQPENAVAEEPKEKEPPPAKVVKTKAQVQNEEEKLLEEAYKKLVEDMQREEYEKLRKEEEAKAKQEQVKSEEDVEKESESEEDDQDENYSPEKMLKTLKNPRRRGMILDRLQRNDEIKNIVLQLTDTDLEKLDNVQSALKGFFSENDFPDFYRSKLKDSKFTPYIDFSEANMKKYSGPVDSEEVNNQSEVIWEEDAQQRYERAKLEEFIERKARESVQGVIKTQGIHHKLKLFDNKITEILESMGEALVDNTGQPLDMGRKFEVLKEQLWAVEHIMKQRTSHLSGLSKVHENAVRRISSIKKYYTEPPKKEQKDHVVPQKATRIEPLEKTKKYKVNVTLLQKREEMSRLEIMERRYKVINGELL